MTKSFSHDLSIDLASKATRAALDFYGKKYPTADITVDWQTPRKGLVGFTALGARVEGVLDVLPAAIQVSVDVPARLKLFEGMVVNLVGVEIQKCIAQAKAGTLVSAGRDAEGTTIQKK